MLFLASQSPRRAELLTRLGVEFKTLTLDVPEQRQPGEAALDYVQRVALEKAQASFAHVSDMPDAIVLGADTEVILDDVVFGKPVDTNDAAAMLARLSGRTHVVASAVALVSDQCKTQIINLSEVTFASLSSQTIATYVQTGESMGKAGAYAIQGRGEALVQHLSGSYSGVMGLPLHDVANLLKQFGVI